MASEKIPDGREKRLTFFQNASATFSGALRKDYGLSAEEAAEFAGLVAQLKEAAAAARMAKMVARSKTIAHKKALAVVEKWYRTRAGEMRANANIPRKVLVQPGTDRPKRPSRM